MNNNNKTLEAMQKMIASYHVKDPDTLKLGCTLPNLAFFCQRKYTDAKLYSLTEGEVAFWRKLEKMLFVVHLSRLHGKQLLMKLLFGNRQFKQIYRWDWC